MTIWGKYDTPFPRSSRGEIIRKILNRRIAHSTTPPKDIIKVFRLEFLLFAGYIQHRLD
jgi:hypothetical protein